MANTIVWNKHDYVQKMRSRINKPITWTDILNVKISDNRTIVNSYMSTESVVQGGTRDSAYTPQPFALTVDSLTISTYKVLPMTIDEADRHQQNYADQMGIADFQGKKINEYIEAQMLAQYGSWTSFGVTDLANSGADDTANITVSAANIDDLIRAIKRKIHTNNGIEMAVENGYFIVWRPSDFEILEAFVQANGFTEADISLKNGIPVQKAFRYMGVDHYLSTQHTANYVFAGIKKAFEIGILRSTWGRAKFIEDPGLVSGLGIVTRADYGWNQPAQLIQFSMAVHVA